MQVFAELFFKIETAGQVLDRTKMQWNALMRKEWRWMGNCVMGEDRTPVYSYRNLDEKHLKIMIHSIYGAQQIRSQSLSLINRHDIGKNRKH